MYISCSRTQQLYLMFLCVSRQVGLHHFSFDSLVHALRSSVTLSPLCKVGLNAFVYFPWYASYVSGGLSSNITPLLDIQCLEMLRAGLWNSLGTWLLKIATSPCFILVSWKLFKCTARSTTFIILCLWLRCEGSQLKCFLHRGHTISQLWGVHKYCHCTTKQIEISTSSYSVFASLRWFQSCRFSVAIRIENIKTVITTRAI